MISGVDSSYFKPNPAAVQQAVDAGFRVWSGYLVTKPGVRIAAPWSQGEFDVARGCGSMPLAYCSGWDDPVACKQLAAQWSVRLCLDVEDSIRGDGPWVQPWLDASGAGLYGGAGVHYGRNAAFHVLAAYPGYDPKAVWYIGYPRPPGPLGWQWKGSTSAFGGDVDLTYFDDWFLGGAPTSTDDTAEVLLLS